MKTFTMHHTDKMRQALDVYEARNFSGMQWKKLAEMVGVSRRQAFLLYDVAEKALNAVYSEQK